eukprot:scaffold86334_cov26-Cyclotella_meneghiniana.AAC.1
MMSLQLTSMGCIWQQSKGAILVRNMISLVCRLSNRNSNRAERHHGLLLPEMSSLAVYRRWKKYNEQKKHTQL